MVIFSEREGFAPEPKLLGIEDVTYELKFDLWNFIYLVLKNDESRVDFSPREHRIIFNKVWIYMGKFIEDFPDYKISILSALKNKFFNGEWYVVYDILEIINNVLTSNNADLPKGFSNYINDILENHQTVWRFVDGTITLITEQEAIDEIENALDQVANLPGVKHHIKRSLELLGDKKHPDAENAIKEAISAVEGLAKIISNDEDGTLGSMLNTFKNNGMHLHPYIADGWKKLYHYTSDEDGIRHAAVDFPKNDLDIARYFVISCSAFINLLIAQAHKNNISLV